MQKRVRNSSCCFMCGRTPRKPINIFGVHKSTLPDYEYCVLNCYQS